MRVLLDQNVYVELPGGIRLHQLDAISMPISNDQVWLNLPIGGVRVVNDNRIPHHGSICGLLLAIDMSVPDLRVVESIDTIRTNEEVIRRAIHTGEILCEAGLTRSRQSPHDDHLLHCLTPLKLTSFSQISRRESTSSSSILQCSITSMDFSCHSSQENS